MRVIVVDDEDRENEGDFICAAECVTPEIINFMDVNMINKNQLIEFLIKWFKEQRNCTKEK